MKDSDRWGADGNNLEVKKYYKKQARCKTEVKKEREKGSIKSNIFFLSLNIRKKKIIGYRRGRRGRKSGGR